MMTGMTFNDCINSYLGSFDLSEVQFEDGTDVTKSLNATTTYKMQNASSGIIPKAKIKTIKMTFVIVLGKVCFLYAFCP